MNKFDLSLIAPKKEEQDKQVQPSTTYDKVTDPDTKEKTDRKITDSGLPVIKDGSKNIKLAGPIGHMYTELLNRQLSLESIAGAVAAAASVEDAEQEHVTGKVTISDQGISREYGNSDGMVFVFSGQDLKDKGVVEISDQILEAKAKSQGMPVGVAVIDSELSGPTLESLYRCMQPSGIRVVCSLESMTDMVKEMAGK